MCVSCGCGDYRNDHGDKRNITIDQVQDAADAAGLSAMDVADNIAEAASSEGAGEQPAMTGEGREREQS